MLFPSQKPSSSSSLLKLLRHQSVSGAPPPKKNPGSAPGNVLKHDTPGIISCGLCFGANRQTKITDFRNRSSPRWFVHGPRWQTKCSAASWSALIACETSCAFSSLKKCCRVTEWKVSEMHHFSRSVSSHLIFKISLEPQYLYNGFLRSKSTSVKTLAVTC